MIDLHTHSTASDGNLTPSQLVALAVQKKISILALTDHDTTAGLAEAEDAANTLGIHLVRGIELNIDWPRGEFHLLGLGLQQESKSLTDICTSLQEGRVTRNREIMQKMKDDGFAVSYEELLEFSGETTCIGRPHVAAYMIEKKICKHRQQAFDKYLGKGRPYYVERTAADLHDAIFAIQDSGGIPVLAHPLSLYVSWGKMNETLSDLQLAGIEGLEAWHSGVRVGEAMRLEEYARKLGFFVTAGSDFHGEHIRSDRKLGHTAGMREIEDRFWEEELRPALERKKA
ncbi:MAG: PHP domain-containing protein [Treponemataceae bacterium]|nr:PHP domain-containing protein [Treponemataceae bacterium]